MSSYNNKSIAQLFTEAHEHFDAYEGTIWEAALAECKALYESTYDGLSNKGLAGGSDLGEGGITGAGFVDGKETFEHWYKENRHGQEIVADALAAIDARMGGANGSHFIWSGCKSSDARYYRMADKSPLYELYSSTVFDVGITGLKDEQNLIEHVKKAYPDTGYFWKEDSEQTQWIRTMLAAGSTAATSDSRKELLIYGYDACAPDGKITIGNLQKWITSIVQPFFTEAAAEEMRETDVEQNVVWDPLTALTNTPEEWKEYSDNLNEASRQFKEELEYLALKRDIEFKEQCFLLSNIQEFAAVKMLIDQEGNKIFPDPEMYNSSLMVHGDPYGLMNVLTQSPHKEEFFEMPTQTISALQPMIRLFKITSDANGNESQVEMKFDSHYRKEDVEEFMATKEMRGHGIGLKSFNFSFYGSDPFSATRAIKAKLVLFASSFSEFMKPRKYTALEPDPEDPELNMSVTRDYKYMDLAIKTGGTKSFSLDGINPQNNTVSMEDTGKLNFRLKAIVGWANPAGSQSGLNSSVISNNLLDAIYDSSITLNLTPTIHDFGIDEMGRTTLTIDYQAHSEEFFDQPNYNIFTDKEALTSQIIRRIKYKTLNENCDDERLREIINEEKNSDEQAKKIEDEKLKNMRSLMNNMLREKKIRFINIPLDDLNTYRAGGPFRKVDKKYIEQLKNSLIVTVGTERSEEISGTAISDVTAAAPIEDGVQSAPSNKVIIDPNQCVTFFYAGDLIDVILKYIGVTLRDLPDELEKAMLAEGDYMVKYDLTEEINNYRRFADNFMKFRLILGPIELVDSNTSGKIADTNLFNLGDIPISAKYFMEFLTERIFKREAQIYTLPEFLNDFFNQFIRDFLNNDTCYGNRAKQKARLSKNVITAYNEDQHHGFDPITYWCLRQNRRRMDLSTVGSEPDGPPRPVLNVMGKRNNVGFDGGFDKEINYLTYFISRVQPTEQMIGCKKGPCYTGELEEDGSAEVIETGDHDRGIWHYQIGKDKGIVKTINLVKNVIPGQAEARWEQQGYDGLQQLRVLYNANIKTFLDVNAYPGTYIYVEPRGFDPATEHDLTQFGIGGYLMIKSAEHSLGPGFAETSIDAQWVAEISNTAPEQGGTTQEVETQTSTSGLKKCNLGLLEERSALTSLDAALAKAGWEGELPGSEETDTQTDDGSKQLGAGDLAGTDF